MSGPTSEIGVVSNTLSPVSSWGQLIDDAEFAPDLKHPASVFVYDKMRADAQLQGLLTGTVLPIQRFRWSLRDAGADPKLTDQISTELKLPVKGREEQYTEGRTRNRFTFARHLPDALRALPFGHYYFEQVGEIGDDGLWHLKKLAPRPPRTLSQILVDPDGGLKGIKQFTSLSAGWGVANEIPVERLVAYVWDKEGANWYGRSIFRSCFRNWLVKDRLIRVDAGKHERNGMGVPWIEAPEGASQDLIDALDEVAQAYRSGEEAGGAGPYGAKLRLVGTEGTLPDTVGSMKWHDEQMARAFMMLFVELGTSQHGSRALGESFIDFFAYAQEAVADWIVDVFNEHVIEDWVDWNAGEDVVAPKLQYERSAHEDLPTADLAVLVEKGIVTVDPELESAIRDQYKLPAKVEQPPEAAPAPPQPPQPPQPAPTQAAERRRGQVAAAAEVVDPSPLPLPDRKLRRQPYSNELMAKVDYARMDTEWVARRDDLFTAVKKLQQVQIDELHDAIVAADGDLIKLTELAATPNAESEILAAMQAMADEGISQAEAEAKAQGKASVKLPKLSELEDSLAHRAQAVDSILTRELSGAAGNQAIRLTGGSLTPKEVAAQTKDYLTGFKGARVKDQLSGAITNAQNSGRKLLMVRNAPSNIYASELLDENTCETCAGIDGTEYGSMIDAEADYPGGGYSDCLGGERCRGTLVAVYDEVQPGPGTGG